MGSPEIVNYIRLSSTTAIAVLQMSQDDADTFKSTNAEKILYKKYLNDYLNKYYPEIKVIDLLNDPDYSKDMKDPNRVKCTLNFKVAKS